MKGIKLYLWVMAGIIFIFSCDQRAASNHNPSQGENKISNQTKREVHLEKLRKLGMASLESQSSKEALLLKEALERISREARDVGERECGHYYLETREKQLRQKALNIIEESNVPLSKEEVNRLIRRYVEIPIIGAQSIKEEKEAEEKLQKGLADIGQEVEELLQNKIDGTEKAKEKEKFRDKIYHLVEERWGPNFSSQEVDKYVQEYVEKPLEKAN
ncbi:MAG: hypothetical protein AB1797_07725 [bacterium]